MSEFQNKVKKWGLIGGGLVVGVLILQRAFSGSSNSQGDSSSLAAMANLQAQGMAYNLQNGRMQLESRALDAQIAQNQGLLAVRQTEATGGIIAQIGNAMATNTIGQSQIPVAAMQAAATSQQAALMAGAGVASAGMHAASEGINAAANLTFASYAPLLGYGSALASITNLVGRTGTNAVNAVSGVAGSSVNAMSGVAQAGSSANATATEAREASRASQVQSVSSMFASIYSGGMSNMGSGSGGGGGFTMPNFGGGG